MIYRIYIKVCGEIGLADVFQASSGIFVTGRTKAFLLFQHDHHYSCKSVSIEFLLCFILLFQSPRTQSGEEFVHVPQAPRLCNEHETHVIIYDVCSKNPACGGTKLIGSVRCLIRADFLSPVSMHVCRKQFSRYLYHLKTTAINTYKWYMLIQENTVFSSISLVFPDDVTFESRTRDGG